MTQEQVAARARVSREYINMVENDRKSPTIRVFVQICRAIQVKPSSIMRRIEK